MEDILQKFEKYLLMKNQISINTFNFYIKDIHSFLNFIKEKNYNCWNSNIELNSSDMNNYFEYLSKLKCGLAVAKRKKSAIQLFLDYLHSNYDHPKINYNLEKFAKFPILISNQQLNKILSNKLQNISQENLTIKDLRNIILIMIIYHTTISIKKIINLNFDNFDLQTQILKFKGKEFYLPNIFFQILEKYQSNLNLKSNYLFAIKQGNNISHISYAATWPIINNFLEKYSQPNNNINSINQNFQDNSNDIDKNYIATYKKSHPRS